MFTKMKQRMKARREQRRRKLASRGDGGVGNRVERQGGNRDRRYGDTGGSSFGG